MYNIFMNLQFKKYSHGNIKISGTTFEDIFKQAPYRLPTTNRYIGEKESCIWATNIRWIFGQKKKKKKKLKEKKKDYVCVVAQLYRCSSRTFRFKTSHNFKIMKYLLS